MQEYHLSTDNIPRFFMGKKVTEMS